MGASTSPPATASSSRPWRSFCGPVYATEGRAAENDRAGHLLAPRLVLLPVRVAARAAAARRHAHRHAARRLQPAAVCAHVLDARLGVAGNDIGRRQIGRAVETRRRDRDRERVEAVALAVERVALDDDLLARRVGEFHRRDRVGDRPAPPPTDLVLFHAHADAVDRAIGRERADNDRDVVGPALAVGDVREQERLALGLRDAAAELPADQRMHLGVLVDGLVDPQQQPGLVKRGEMFLKVGIALVGGGHVRRRHAGSHVEQSVCCSRARKAHASVGA